MEKIKLQIYTWPEKILRKKTRKISIVDEHIRILLSDMVSLMRISKGVGLAANQVGLDLSLVVAEIDGEVLKLVNPRIEKCEGSISFLEGCLSFPGIELEIKRKNKILVSGLDQDGQIVNREFQGFGAVVLQHEIDHIQGIVFIDRASFWQKLKTRPKLKKISQKTKNELYK